MSTQPIIPITIWYPEVYNFWLDELEIYATFIQNDLLEWVDFDNSNYIEFAWFIVTKHEVPKYDAKFMFAKDGIPMFAYYIWRGKSEKVWVATKNYFCAYGSAFRALWAREVFMLFYRYFTPESDYPLRRADIYIDLLMQIDHIISMLDPDIKTENTFKKNWKLETLYIGENAKTNKRYVIRIYNKIRDIKKKKKYALYSAYLEHKDITRVEIEFRRELLRQATIADFYNEEIFTSIFKNYIQLHTKAFEFLDGNIRNLTKPRDRASFDTLQSQAYHEQRAKLLIAYAKGLFSFGMCPVEILLWENLIHEKTKYGLWYTKYSSYILNLKRMERHSYKRKYALWKQKDSNDALIRDFNKIFPDAPDKWI